MSLYLIGHHLPITLLACVIDSYEHQPLLTGPDYAHYTPTLRNFREDMETREAWTGMIEAEEDNSLDPDVNGEACHVYLADLNLMDTITCEDCGRQVCHETCAKPIPSEVCTPCQLRRSLRDYHVRGIPAENVHADREPDRGKICYNLKAHLEYFCQTNQIQFSQVDQAKPNPDVIEQRLPTR